PLVDLVRAQLAHFGELMNGRIVIRGPDLKITASAAQPIGMALQELATNAAKYGALSNETGHVNIEWRLEGAGVSGHRFAMGWIESGGPTVVAPTRCGFGWSVLSQLTEMSLEADVTLEYAYTWFVWHLRCPADRVCESEVARSRDVS